MCVFLLGILFATYISFIFSKDKINTSLNFCFRFIDFTHLCIWTFWQHVCMRATWVLGAHRGQKTMLGPLDWSYWAWLAILWVLGIKPRPSVRTIALKHWTNSPAPIHFLKTFKSSRSSYSPILELESFAELCPCVWLAHFMFLSSLSLELRHRHIEKQQQKQDKLLPMTTSYFFFSQIEKREKWPGAAVCI